MIAARVGLGAQLRDHFTVHLHPALLDHFLGLAAARHARLGQDFLQSLEVGRGARLGSECGLGFFAFVGVPGLAAVLSFYFGIDLSLRVRGGFDFRFCFSARLRFKRGLPFAVSFVADGVLDFRSGFWFQFG